MASINQIVQGLVDSVKQSDNHNLKERLKLSFKHRLANRLRQDAEKNGAAVEYAIRFTVALSKVDKIDDCNISLDCTILRTTDVVPRPVRIKRDAYFMFAGDATGNAFRQVYYWEIEDLKHSRYSKDDILVTTVNQYAYVIGNQKLKWLTLMDMFNTQDLIGLCTNGGTVACYTDDSDFPAPTDMIESVKDEIRQKELNQIEENKEVEIKNDRA